MDAAMTRKSNETILVRNLIDFDPASDRTPRNVVEWWASQMFESFVKTPPKGFGVSPLTFMVDTLEKATAVQIRDAYLVSEDPDLGMKEKDFYEALFVAHCREKFRRGSGVNIHAPVNFVMSELSCALLDLARELEQHGEVPYEDIDECIKNPPKPKSKASSAKSATKG